jgi:hypothetical protein
MEGEELEAAVALDAYSLYSDALGSILFYIPIQVACSYNLSLFPTTCSIASLSARSNSFKNDSFVRYSETGPKAGDRCGATFSVNQLIVM